MQNTRSLLAYMNLSNTIDNEKLCILSQERFEKLILVFNAIFEGIGYAGIISAAFWYATAPIAPEGFKGPISTFTIAITTMSSLILAIPIAYFAFKRSINDLVKFNAELLIETNRFDDLTEEIYFELLRLRTYFHSDSDFLRHCHTLHQYKDMEEVCHEVCQSYTFLKNKYIFVRVENEVHFSIHDRKNDHYSLSFEEILKQNSLRTKLFRKTILNHVLNFKKIKKPSPIANSSSPIDVKHMSYAFVAAITCIEVLLSICWTVASILIGIKIVSPISTQSWLFFASLCLIIGPLFGIGMYFNKRKEQHRHDRQNQIRQENNTIRQVLEQVNTLLAKKMLQNQSIVIKLEEYDVTLKKYKPNIA